MIDWNIQSRSHACQNCHRHFADKEIFHTLLFDQKNAYERLDVCEPCWTSQFSQGGADRKGFISYWHGVYTVPPASPPDAIQKETAETLLRKLVEENAPARSASRYILAVMLERKRVLKIKAQISEAGERVFIYEHAHSGDLFKIVDPKLQLDQLEQVQRDVAELLEHGLNTPAQTSVASTPAQQPDGLIAPDDAEPFAAAVEPPKVDGEPSAVAAG